MTYEEFINSLVPGVQFYDDFRGNGLGVAVPTGWTKLTGQTPEIIEDVTAFGGKALKLANVIAGSEPTAIGMDAAGEPAYYEILMRLKVDAEYTKQCTGAFSDGANSFRSGTGPCEPDGPPFFGGPGGHLSFGGSVLRGIGFRGTNRAAFVRGDLYWGFGACHLVYRPAYGGYQFQRWYIVASNAAGVFGEPFNDDSALMYSGQPTLVTGAFLCDDNRRVRFVDPPSQGQFGPPLSDSFLGPVIGLDVNYIRGTPGNARQYNYMRLRVGGSAQFAMRVKWWPGDKAEPLSWLTIESDLPSPLAPPVNGPCGILHVPHPTMSPYFDPHTIIDFVSISLSPDHPAATPPDTPVAGCPLPNGEVGVQYDGTFDPDGLYQPA